METEVEELMLGKSTGFSRLLDYTQEVLLANARHKYSASKHRVLVLLKGGYKVQRGKAIASNISSPLSLLQVM